MIVKMDMSFGPDSRNRLNETADPSARGAEADPDSLRAHQQATGG
jgi:hypothetical protein